MTPLDQAAVLDTSCVQCGALPGQRCRSKRGRIYTRPYFHVHRMAVIDPGLLRPRRGLPRYHRIWTTTP